MPDGNVHHPSNHHSAVVQTVSGMSEMPERFLPLPYGADSVSSHGPR